MSKIQMIHSAAAAAASFHFQKLFIELPGTYGEIFPESGEPAASLDKWGLLMHEMTHYFQCISTVLGQSIILNWMTVIQNAGSCVSKVDPLPVPMYSKEAKANPDIQRAAEEISSYFRETNPLIGARHELRPESEATVQPEDSLYPYRFEHPNGGHSDAFALRLTSPDGEAFGVPILGDALTEGMAQCVQWIASNKKFAPAVLSERPCDPNPRGGAYDIYYTAIPRMVESRLPEWSVFITSIILCDAALCSRTPGKTLAEIVDNLKNLQPPPNLEGYKQIRRDLDQRLDLREGRTFIRGKIDEALSDASNHSDVSAPLFERIYRLFRKSWELRDKDPAAFIDSKYDKAFLDRVTPTLGSPPIFTRQDEEGSMVYPEDLLLRSYTFIYACYDLLTGLYFDGIPEPCPLLKSVACRSAKTEACTNNRLSIPPAQDGRNCVMAFASSALGIQNRSLVVVVVNE